MSISRNSKLSQFVSDKSSKYFSKDFNFILNNDQINYRSEDSQDYSGTYPRESESQENIKK